MSVRKMMIDMLTTNISMDSLLPLLYTDDDKTPVVQNRCEEELEEAEKTKTDKMVHLESSRTRFYQTAAVPHRRRGPATK